MISKVLLSLDFQQSGYLESRFVQQMANVSWHHVTNFALYLAYKQALLFG